MHWFHASCEFELVDSTLTDSVVQCFIPVPEETSTYEWHSGMYRLKLTTLVETAPVDFGQKFDLFLIIACDKLLAKFVTFRLQKSGC